MRERVEAKIRDRALQIALDELAGREVPPCRVAEIRGRRESEPPAPDTGALDPRGSNTRGRSSRWVAAALILSGISVTASVQLLTSPPPDSQDPSSATERADSQRTGYFRGGLGRTDATPTVFLFDGADSLLALELSTGEAKWTSKLSSDEYCSPVVHGGSVYLGSKTGDLYALDATTGKFRWKRRIDPKDGYHFDGSRLRVAFFGGVIYCSLRRGKNLEARGRYAAIHERTGRFLWSFDAEGTFEGHVLGGGRIYAACSNGSLYALDMATGHRDWTAELGLAKPQPPLLQDGHVYVAGDDRVCAVSIGKGEVEWQQQLAGLEYHLCTPSLSKSKDRIFVGETALYCLRRTDGKVLWDQSGMILRGATIAHGDVVFAGNMIWHSLNGAKLIRPDGQKPALVAFDQKTGKVRWKNDELSDIVREMAVGRGLVCAISRQMKAVFAFDADTGKLKWKHDLRKQNLSAPCIADASGAPKRKKGS